MKKYILLIFACIYAIHLNAQNAGINFLHGTTWAEAVAKAKAENKLIFIDFYTQWCGPCLNMAQTVFSLPTVGYYYNQTFINLKIDAEEGEGITLAKKYGVRSYLLMPSSILLPKKLFIAAAAVRLPNSLFRQEKMQTFLPNALFTCKSNIPRGTENVHS